MLDAQLVLGRGELLTILGLGGWVTLGERLSSGGDSNPAPHGLRGELSALDTSSTLLSEPLP